MAGWSVGSFMLTFALLFPAASQADGPAHKQVLSIINEPLLTVQGCELSLRLENPPEQTSGGTPLFQPGDAPLLQLVAWNNSDQEASIDYSLAMNARVNPSRESRVPITVPKSLWTHADHLMLKPHEQVQVELATDVKLLPSRSVSVTLSSGKLGIIPINFAVTAPQPTTRPATK
jgi:hypothetical protein